MNNQKYYQNSLTKLNEKFDNKLKNKFFFTSKKSIEFKRMKAIKQLETFYKM